MEILELKPTNETFERIIMEEGEEIILGREQNLPSCCKFTENKISTHHTRIFQEGTDIYVEDKSTNGTFINGQKIGRGQKSKLKDGDELSLVIPSGSHKLANCIVILFDYSVSII